ncbi:hypothetical protein [Vibrio cyclitrophicus]|uniref:hypothetical protein n=1 Tax=Vibrio cyclitrophicus TaxID=47951 RepID=UPI0024A77268|nr:hypothetical protein [Vibrio cyclitrophicus]
MTFTSTFPAISVRSMVPSLFVSSVMTTVGASGAVVSRVNVSSLLPDVLPAASV